MQRSVRVFLAVCVIFTVVELIIFVLLPYHVRIISRIRRLTTDSRILGNGMSDKLLQRFQDRLTQNTSHSLAASSLTRELLIIEDFLNRHSSRKVHTATKVPMKQKRRVMTIIFPPGRLGNELFCFASFVGIATSLNMDLLLFGSNCNNSITLYFQVNIRCNESLSNHPGDLQRFVEARAATYDKRVEIIKTDPNAVPVMLTGYMQSWKYFDKFRNTVLEQLVFKRRIKDKSISLFRELLYETFNSSTPGKFVPELSKDTTLVGIHVRRTDMTSNYSHSRGYVEAPKAYLTMAMNKMESILSAPILYVVISDDMQWCTSEIERSNRTVIFYNSGNAAVDLAMMSSCSHNIITSGTYGWWGAYLAGGHTIYYSRYPRPGSFVHQVTSTADYYPPTWIGLP